MKWVKKFFKTLQRIAGIKMVNPYQKCIASLEDQFQGLSDEEYFMTIAILDSGLNCEMVFGAVNISRRKRSFLRKLKELGITLTSREKLLEKYIEDLRGSKSVDELVENAKKEYLLISSQKNSSKTNSI